MTTAVCRNTVLVIDDDDGLRELIEMIAMMSGVPVLQAPDCRQGLKILERDHPRIKLVLLDYFMPGMEPAVCAAAIMEKAGSAIPVVLVTAAVDPGIRAAELKISRWVSKPFETSTITSLVTQS